MDLGIAGRRAIVCGGSKGLGRGCAVALAREGVHVWLVARSREALVEAARDDMIERRFGRVVNITSHMVKSPAAILGLSNGARAGLTGFIGGLARDVAAHNVTLNNLLPGAFDTDRLRSNQEKLAAGRKLPVEELRDRMRDQIPARRFGTSEEFGA